MRKTFSFGSALLLLFTCHITWAQNSSLKISNQKKASRSPSANNATAPVLSKSGSVSTSVSANTTSSNLQNISVSQNVLIPAKGQIAVSVKAQHRNRILNFQTKVNGVAQKDYETQKGLMVVTRFDRGTESGWAIAGEVGSALGAMTESRKGMKDSESSGLTDLAFTATKAKNLEKTQLFYGGSLGFSPGERVWATEKESGNLYSGGHSLSAFFGLQNDFRTHIAGAKFHHDMFLDRSESFKSGNQKINVTRSNGNIFAADAFFEKPMNGKVFGAQAGIGIVQPTDLRLSTTGTKMDFGSGQYNVLNLGAYGRFQLKEMGRVELLPSWTYSKVISSSGGNYSVEDSSETSNIALAARWPL